MSIEVTVEMCLNNLSHHVPSAFCTVMQSILVFLSTQPPSFCDVPFIGQSCHLQDYHVNVWSKSS